MKTWDEERRGRRVNEAAGNKEGGMARVRDAIVIHEPADGHGRGLRSGPKMGERIIMKNENEGEGCVDHREWVSGRSREWLRTLMYGEDASGMRGGIKGRR